MYTMTSEIPTLSNPRRETTIDDWPIGRQRCRCRFAVEAHPKRGERVARWTENKTRTGWNNPKKTTYATRFAIVDGDDGRTYLLSFNRDWGCIVLHAGDMKHHITTIRHDDGETEAWKMWLGLIKEAGCTS